jgi:hypothetical protein
LRISESKGTSKPLILSVALIQKSASRTRGRNNADFRTATLGPQLRRELVVSEYLLQAGRAAHQTDVARLARPRARGRLISLFVW